LLRRSLRRLGGAPVQDCGNHASRPNEHLPFDKPGFTGTFYFQTEDVNSIWEKLRDKVAVVYPIEDFEYGMREFAVRDNNGYILQFGQEIATP
jgi:uncharacterized glyoxalase superfamily protein PhnB